MNTNQIYQLIIDDLNNSKCTKNIQLFKDNIHKFSKSELNEIYNLIETNIYLGQHGVDDLAWINLKHLIRSIA